MARRALSRLGEPRGRGEAGHGSLAGSGGQSMVLFAMAMVSIVGMLGLAIDGGAVYALRRATQNSVDAAALAGARELLSRKGDYSAAAEQAVLLAIHDQAERNGVEDSNGTPGDGINDNIEAYFVDEGDARLGGPMGTNGFVPVAARGVEVSAVRSYESFFAGIVGHGTLGVWATATARYESVVANWGLLALDPSACGAINVHGKGDLFVHNAGIHANSDCSSALWFTGQSETFADEITSAGSHYIEGPASVTPTPVDAISPVTDPLATLPAPSFAGLPVFGDPFSPTTLEINGPIGVTLTPGIYYGGIEITGQANVTFEPGTYILAGGGLQISGQGDVTGYGVFFYNTNDPIKPTGDGAYGDLYIAGNGVVDFTPPTSGPYENLLFFQDRFNSQPFYVAGNGLGGIQGTAYAPAALVDIAGTGTATAQFIASTIEVRGNGLMDITYDENQLYHYEIVFLSR